MSYGYQGPTEPNTLEEAAAMLDRNPEYQQLFVRANQVGPDDTSRQDLESMYNQINQAGAPSQGAQSHARGLFSHKNSDKGENKGNDMSMKWKLISGAAGWQAMKWYESSQQSAGKEVNHAFMKKALAGYAMSKAVSMAKQFGIHDKETQNNAASAAASHAMKMFDRSSGGAARQTNEPNQY
ncbi:hypothetical protein IWQ60_012284 [Tieghemiomyces parasiticus]|uniref:Uncharacterized protein n=1 Tax=Tieghemiomyces parasiticus TaxID=78921 RepID=A0A9W8DGJ8_9FUNG|nr:hypothetical protein IWQ60_012284 [Tieghemiomyces parasiticus]